MQSKALSFQKSQTRKTDVKHYLDLFGLTAVFSLLIYRILPIFNVRFPSQILSGKLILAGIAALAALVLYLEYVRYWRRQPKLLLLFCAIFPVLWNYLGEVLISMGVNLRGTLLLFPLVIVPVLFLLRGELFRMLSRFAFLKWLFAFLGWLTFLFFFHNINYQLPVSANFTALGTSRYNDFASLFVYSIFFEFICASLAVFVMGRVTDFRAFFETFNRVLALFTVSISVIPVILFPLGYDRMFIEGVWRSNGVFSHPNNNAFYLSFLGLYFLGLFLSKTYSTRQTATLMLLASLSSLIALLFTFSKTVLFAHGLLLFVLLAIFMATRQDMRRVMLSGGILLALGLIGTILVGVFFGGDLMKILSERFEDTRSLDWRFSLWGRLMEDMNASTLLFGNGLTSAYQKVFEVLYFDNRPDLMASMQPHNINIHFIYEMGLPGMAYIVSLLVLSSHMIMHAIRKTANYQRSDFVLLLLPLLLFLDYLIYYSFNNYNLVIGSLIWIVMSTLAVYQHRQWRQIGPPPERRSVNLSF